jgi:hypothetical protein
MFLYCSTMPARWKSDRPMSRQQFEARFPDDAACARYLVGRRWPDGFVCPVCGACKGWALNHDRPAWECAGCRRQTSVTAGTLMHGSHLPLRTWFMAAHIIASHSNGISALELQAQVGIGSTKAAWLLLHKLRRAMVDPDRSLLQKIVEVDETEMPFRRKANPTKRPAERPAEEPDSSRKIRVVGAVELSQDGHPRRIRLEQIFDRSSKTLHGFGGRMVEPGAHVITDGLISYGNMPGNTHEPWVVSGRKAHEILHWVHRVFSNLKRSAKGVVRQIRPPDGFVTPPTPWLSPEAHPTLSRRVCLPLEPPPPSANGIRPAHRDRCRSRAGHLSRHCRASRLIRPAEAWRRLCNT